MEIVPTSSKSLKNPDLYEVFITNFYLGAGRESLHSSLNQKGSYAVLRLGGCRIRLKQDYFNNYNNSHLVQILGYIW